jgi:uroporphyrinogen-III decarboxylase
MEAMSERWKARNQRSEALLGEVFKFRNAAPAAVIVDANYWTFGDLPEEIPDDHYTNPASALAYQTAKIERHFEQLPDDAYIPFLHPWYGTGVLASAFGLGLICNPKADPAVDLSKMQDPAEIDGLIRPVAGVSGAMATVTRCFDYFRGHSDLPVAITDCQGPLTTAFQIAGYDKFCYWMQDDPARIHRLMALVTEALIDWVRFQKERAGQPLDGCAFPLSVKLPEGHGGVWLSDDDSVLMSAELYREFVKPYNERILKAFGGGCIHYCGNSTQNIANYAATEGLTAINNFNLDNIEAAAKMRRALREKGIVYMACDFAPSDARLGSYYPELIRAMDGPEGLVIAAYVAPAIELDRGQYAPASRDRMKVARTIFETIQISCAGREVQ